jgi:hypothetical protein
VTGGLPDVAIGEKVFAAGCASEAIGIDGKFG